MLLSWRDEVCIALCPDRVILARVAGRWRPRVLAKEIVPCHEHDAADWKPCVAALVRALADARWKDADASVTLSNHFVRFALVPWHAALATDDEKLAWVRHHFVEIYGDAVANARYRWSEEGPAEACLASAIDGEFVDQVRQAFEGSALRLRTIRPYLMSVFNRIGPRARGKDLWLIAPEPGHVCLGAIAQGRWRGITSRHIGADWQTELRTLLDRELVIAGGTDAPQAVFAYAPQLPAFQIPQWTKVPLHPLAPRALPGFSPYTDAEYAMALTGRV